MTNQRHKQFGITL